MPVESYRLHVRGNLAGGGVCDAIHVALAAIAKKASDGHEYIVANELFCNQIARFLQLPCPPGAIMEDDGDRYYTSLNFSLNGLTPPPARANQMAADIPELCWGIILFDALIMNTDRHRENLYYDARSQRSQIFDHTHAFAGCGGDVVQNFGNWREGLGIGGRHCLAEHISTIEGREGWLDKIRLLPDFYIESAINDACDVGLPIAHKNLYLDVVNYRRDNLRTIMEASVTAFPKLGGEG